MNELNRALKALLNGEPVEEAAKGYLGRDLGEGDSGNQARWGIIHRQAPAQERGPLRRQAAAAGTLASSSWFQRP